MSLTDRVVGTITAYSKVAIAVMLVLTVLIGAGAGQVEQTSSLDQFQSDTPEAKDLEYINQHFSTGPENTTTVQIIVRGENVLSQSSLLEMLRYERALRENQTVNATLVEDTPITGVANVVATTAIRQEQASELQARAAALQNRSAALNETARSLASALDTIRSNPNASIRTQFEQVRTNTSVELDAADYRTFQRAALAIRSNVTEMRRTVTAGARTVLSAEFTDLTERRATLNRTGRLLRAALGTLRANPNASIRTQFEQVRANTSVDLGADDYATFADAATALRTATSPEAVRSAYRQGTRGVLADEARQLGQRATALNTTARLVGGALGTIAQDPNASARTQFEDVRSNAPVSLDEEDWRAFNATVEEIRTLQANVQTSYRLGTRGVLRDEFGALRSRAAELQADRKALQSADRPSLSAQIAQLRSMNDSAIDAIVTRVLSGGNGGAGALNFMSTNYNTGSTTAEATMLVVTQRTASSTAGGTTASDAIIDAQLAMQDIGNRFEHTYMVFGSGIISHEINQSMTDSMLIVGPLALFFVLLALAIGYRDIFDIVLGLFGIAAVLVWTFGFMGWADIAFNQIFVAVPVLLIGLSIDYAIHIFMRHREEREAGDDIGPRKSMRIALGGVGVALTLVTATTVIGFLSNLTSPIPPIREFGIVSAVGITAALLIFGVLVPAIKVELDEFLEGFGIDREKRAIGTGGGRLSQALRLGSIGARKAPYVVIVAALLLSAGGAYAGSQVDTSFAQEDFLAEDPPGWMDRLPEPFDPGEYHAKDNLNYVDKNFGRENSQAQLLIRGDVATASALDRIDQARETITGQDVTQKLPTGEPDMRSPLTVMHTVAATNATFNATFDAADTDDDGVPDRNVAAVYDTLYRVAPQQAQSVLYRADGEYKAARIVVAISGGASSSAVTDQMRSVAKSLSGNGLEVTATGQTIIFEIVQNQLLETVIQSLLITLVAVFAFLMIVYRISDGSATLGFVTLLPVVLSVAWILGTMYAFGIPFNVMTGMITSLTVGLGVAYSIHLSERYNQELERTDSVWDALDRAVTGTGGALLGSAATTVGGFGVLIFAILPPLKQFGLITGLTIIYAFLASVLVLPSLLVVWTRLLGPEDAFEDDGTGGTGDGDDADVDAETADASAVTEPRAERDLAPSHVAPGGVVAVTLAVENPPDRLAIRERVSGADLALYSVTPEPTEYVAQGSTLVAAFEDVTDRIVLEYDATVDPDVADGTTLSIDGRALGDEDVQIGGADSITVVTDVVDRVLTEDRVTDEDLRLAADHVATGQLSAEAFEEVCEQWVDTDEE